MDALVMCGGRGTRFDADVEKPLFEVGGVPMVDRVLGAIRRSGVGTVFAVTSPRAPATHAHVEGPTIETPGDGYVEDLDVALEAVEPPVLTAAADLPLLEADIVETLVGRHVEGSLAVVVPAALKRRLGVGVEDVLEWDGQAVAPTGLNIVGRVDAEDMYLSHDARVAINVNRRSDAAIAEELL